MFRNRVFNDRAFRDGAWVRQHVGAPGAGAAPSAAAAPPDNESHATDSTRSAIPAAIPARMPAARGQFLRRVTSSLLAALLALTSLGDLPAIAAPGDSADALQALIARNTQALGGAEALDDVQTMVKRSRIIEGNYRDIAIFATDRQANGHRLELVDSEQLDGESYAVLRLTLADGFENYLWLDEESGFVTRSRNTRALHVDQDDEQKIIESRMSDFQPVGALRHPHRVVEVDLGTGATLVEITLLELRLNPVLGDDYFRDLVGEVPAGDVCSDEHPC